MHAFDSTLLIIRLVVGLTMVAHGWNHAFGGGKLPGTARWFESLGLRPGPIHALMSALVEVGCGVAFAAGFLTPLAAGALLGTMVVAGMIEHRRHGFFIFKNGVEYVLMIGLVLIAVAISGGGKASLDDAIGFHLGAWAGFGACAGIGFGGSALLLGACWRPNRQAPPATTDTAATDTAATDTATTDTGTADTGTADTGTAPAGTA